MIHQVSGLSFGTLREMEDSVAEASRINEMLFNIIKSKTLVTEEQLDVSGADLITSHPMPDERDLLRRALLPVIDLRQRLLLHRKMGQRENSCGCVAA